MGRLVRESLVRHGAIGLALTVAAGLAIVEFLSTIASVAVVIPLQNAVDEDLAFRVGNTTIDWGGVVTAGTTALVSVLALAALWRATSVSSRTCPDCRSEVPQDASVCAFCTSEIPPAR